MTFRPYSDSLNSPRQTYLGLLETQSPLNKSRSGLTGFLPSNPSHQGLTSLNYTDDKVHHQECTIGNLFPEILSTIFEYLDVPAKGRVAQVIQTSIPFCQADMLFKLLRKLINGPYRFERILGIKILNLDTDDTENGL